MERPAPQPEGLIHFGLRKSVWYSSVIGQIHQEFGELFAMKVLIFVQELLSVVLTPFILWFSLPNCAPAIIDFFREFSVHVEGRGYVCSFAEFNFERHGNVKVSSQSTNGLGFSFIANSLVRRPKPGTRRCCQTKAKWRKAS